GTCDYTVQKGDNTDKLKTTISGTGVTDEAGNVMEIFTPLLDKDIAIDTTAPVIASHENITVEATSADGAMVAYDNPTATDNFDESVEVECAPISGSEFDLGTTTVTCDATDDAGNTSTSTFNVTVQDTTGPVFGDMPVIDPIEADGPTGAVVSYTAPTATDIVDADVVVVCNLVSGSTFPLGTTTVTCDATDDAGNTSTSIFNVTVQDTTGPEFGDMPVIDPVEATGPSGAVVSYTTPIATDAVDGDITATCAPESGSIFPLGTTTVTCTATDSYGNSGENSFTVTVQDATAPTIGTHENITVEATSLTGAVVEYECPTATDLVDTDVDVIGNPVSGSAFKLGTTIVTCTATDDYNNSATSTFNITVVDTVAPVISGIVPTENSTTSDVAPEINAVFSDSGIGIDASTATITVDGTGQTAWADIDATGITYVSDPLTDGQHTVAIYVEDYAGNSASTSWTFKVLASAKSITVSSSESELDADGTSSATITASLTEDGTALAGAVVNFSSTIGDLSQDSATTDSSGKAKVTLASTIAGIDTITVSYGSGSNLVQASTSIIFNEIEVDTEAPTATSDPANGETGVAIDSDIVITFSEEMDEETLDNIQLRKYDGATAIASSLEIDGNIVTINPNNALEYNTQYYITISGAEDVAGNVMASWIKSDNLHSFTTKNVATTTIGINLQVGWNLVSLPIIPEDSSIEAVLGETTLSHIEIIQYYDTENEQWLTYKPGVTGGGLTTMEAGKGYWVDMNANDTLTINGYELPSGGSLLPTYEVFGEKWNLIGFKSVREMTAKEYISQMGSDDILYVYKNGKYESLDGDDMMEVGYGYWFYTYDADGFDIVPKK
ncbi:MAG: HYR domain-containing protein, partial [Candidatus Pacebacteria bacterium]|nr:HYR domain-containing protein [Candidatus Paceibacterota bacterium]